MGVQGQTLATEIAGGQIGFCETLKKKKQNKKKQNKTKMKTVTIFSPALFRESRVTNLALAISSGNGMVSLPCVRSPAWLASPLNVQPYPSLSSELLGMLSCQAFKEEGR